MNGCRYCVIVHNRKRKGRRLARGVAMCLAQQEMTRCDRRSHERGTGCEWHDIKARDLNQYETMSQHATFVGG